VRHKERLDEYSIECRAESFDTQRVAPATMAATRPMYWSVRRELWENRAIYIAPLVAAAVILFGFLISTIGLPHKMRALSALDPSKQREAVAVPYDMAAGLIMLTALIVGCSTVSTRCKPNAAIGSILFWKSLPVSDLTTVLSKASIRWSLCHCWPSRSPSPRNSSCCWRAPQCYWQAGRM